MENNQQPALLPLQTQSEDSDWEYEYDEMETESFYVTIDVASASQQTRAPKKTGLSLHTKTPPQNHDEQATLLPTDPAPSEAISTDPPTLSNLQNSRLQILDLHTPEPLISYNNRIYTCTWASTIGTDVFLASPDLLPAAPNDPFRVVPIHSLPNVSVIGTSCINLTGRPTTITPRNCPPKAQPPSSVPGLATGAIPVFIDTTNPPSPPKASNPEHLPNEDAAPNQALKIPLSPTAANPRRAQTSFLESLIAIKASKGETDQVTVYSTKSNQGTGWRVQRRLADEQALLNRDDEDDDGDIEGLDLGHPSSPPTQADNSDDTEAAWTAAKAKDSESWWTV
ncbi:MAG: hypothetical protein L6R40_008170 [Gallowayella cf. fulva]|nr:MAG: hypothetical protein L6R40_008170 [Xanthomendoza cf. fulva]